MPNGIIQLQSAADALIWSLKLATKFRKYEVPDLPFSNPNSGPVSGGRPNFKNYEFFSSHLLPTMQCEICKCRKLRDSFYFII